MRRPVQLGNPVRTLARALAVGLFSGLAAVAPAASEDSAKSLLAQITDALARDPFGIAFNRFRGDRPGVRRLAIAPEGGVPVAHTLENVQSRAYPLANEAYFYVTVKPGEKLDPRVKEFLRYILSAEGQADVAREGRYIPLMADVVRAQLKKIE